MNLLLGLAGVGLAVLVLAGLGLAGLGLAGFDRENSNDLCMCVRMGRAGLGGLVLGRAKKYARYRCGVCDFCAH